MGISRQRQLLMGKPFPNLLSLWDAKFGTRRGPQVQTSAAGLQPDADGNMVPWPNHHPLKGVIVQPAYSNLFNSRRLIISIEGDSRSNEVSPADTFWWNYIDYWLGATDKLLTNYAVGGETIASMVTQYATQAHLTRPNISQVGYFIVIAGANDLGTGVNRTGADTYDLIKQLWAAAKSDGYIVVASTEAGAAGWPQVNKDERDAYNVLVRSDSSLYDYLLEPDIHVPVTTTEYYIDGTHPSDLGARAYATMIAAALPGTFSVPITTETKTLTAQKYCLQAFGVGAEVACSYGTATAAVPLQFTALAGDTEFVGTDCGSWMLSAVGGIVFPRVDPGVSVAQTSATSLGVGASFLNTSQVVAALSARSGFTCAALVWMGYGNADHPAAQNNILSFRNSNIDLYTNNPSYISRGSDGTSFTGPDQVGWDRGEIHLKMVRLNAAGTHFQVGNMRFTDAMVPIDSVPVWGALTVYDGSYNPGTHLRLSYNGTGLLGFLQVQVWNKNASDAEILKVVGYAL